MPTAVRSMSKSKARDDAPVLMLSNSLGTTLHMWDPQVAVVHAALSAGALRPARSWQIRRAQGSLHHGDVSAAMSWRCSTSSASRRRTGAACRWAAWSGSGLAPTPPTGSSRLVLSNTTSYFPTRPRGTTVSSSCARRASRRRRAQHGALVHQGLPRTRARRVAVRMKEMFIATPLEGYLGCCAAVRDMDQRDLLPKIKAPTLVIAGKHDPATLPRRTSTSSNHIPGAKLAVLDAAHIFQRRSSPTPTRRRCWNFCWRGNVRRKNAEQAMDDKERYRRGEDARRKVLGDAWVDRRRRRQDCRSTPNGRISSPAVPGARSGRGRISTSARGAFSSSAP